MLISGKGLEGAACRAGVCANGETRAESGFDGREIIRDGESLIRSLPFLGEKGHVVSLVGGGGKTTWMHAMGLCAAGLGQRVLLTTTTHIGKMPYTAGLWRNALLAGARGENGEETFLGRLLREQERFAWVRTAAETEQAWARGRIPVLGAECGEGKLKMPEKDVLLDVVSKAGLVLIEADGSKGLPCKLPGQGEPVILEECDIVLGFAGMGALGKKYREACFRSTSAAVWERFAAGYCGSQPGEMEPEGLERGKDAGGYGAFCADDGITARSLAYILASEAGTRKNVGSRAYHVVLSQCDDAGRIREAEKIRGFLREKGVCQVILGSFLAQKNRCRK